MVQSAITLATLSLEAKIAEVRQGKKSENWELILDNYQLQLDLIKSIDIKQSLDQIPSRQLKYLYEYIFYMNQSSEYLMRVVSKIQHEREQL
jgi:hypothetical protein